jgi:IS5 family transposase
MKGRLPDQNQRNLFQPNLNQIINPAHELSLLADRIDWNHFENEFSGLYSNTGAPAKPIRLMVSLLLLKHMFNHGDETLMKEWVQNPYYQYFSGMSTFQWKYPCDPSDLVHFRNRIGQSGVEKIFKYSVQMHGSQAFEDQITVDTTVQETNVAFPTDTRLQVKMIKSCVKIADAAGIVLRQRYPRKLRQLLIQARFGHHPKRRKQSNSAKRQIKTIAGRLVRELRRKLSPEQQKLHKELLQLFERQLAQKRDDTNKIYSFHAPHTYCIAKGKEHKPYEFGVKASIASGLKNGIILSAFCLEENDYDGHTVEKVLEQLQKLHQYEPKAVVGDRGYRGVKTIGETQILTPTTGKPGQTAYEKRKMRGLFRRRAAIEPLIGHLKTDHRLERSFYKGIKGDQLNVLLACASWNLKKLMEKLAKAFSWPVFRMLLRSMMNLEQRFSGFSDILIIENARNTRRLSLDEGF